MHLNYIFGASLRLTRGFVCIHQVFIFQRSITMEQNKLRDQIWMTRICRINAEKRLMEKDHFVEIINIYYSLCTTILSVILLQCQSNKLNNLVVAMSIVTLVSVLYIKGLRYAERAGSFRQNYTELQKLEIELSVEGLTDTEIKTIGLQYCDLLAKGENHSSFDYVVAKINKHEKNSKAEINDDNHKNNNVTKTHNNKTKDNDAMRATIEHSHNFDVIQLFWGLAWRTIVKTFFVILPLALIYLTWKG